MAFGKIYSYPGNPRTTAIMAVAKANKLDLEVVHTEPAKGVSDDYKKLNRLGKVPTFEGADNYVLTECIAIAVYLTSQNEKTTLLGKTKQDYASILRWMSFGNSEVLPALGGWFRPLIGRDPYNKKSVDDAQKRALETVKVMEDYLLVNTYLVGERLTLADLFVAGLISRGFEYFFDKEWRKENPNVTRWYETIYNQPIFSEVAGPIKMAEKAMPNVAPKSDKQEKPKADKPKKEAAAPKPKAAKDDDDDDEPAVQEPKPKHPLDLLPRSSFALDELKRKYSNEETREVALPWFWENVPFSDYTLWRCDFKYNEELTMTFMSANQVGGFFNRLEGSRKYIFGCMGVYGQTNDSILRGAFLIRGDKYEDAFNVAPDWESYEFTKLDHTKPEDKEFVDDMWAVDKPITVNGKEYAPADSKVFK